MEKQYTIGNTNHMVFTCNMATVARAAIITLIKEATSIMLNVCLAAKSCNKGNVLMTWKIMAQSAVRKKSIFFTEMYGIHDDMKFIYDLLVREKV